jgi:hypothetical protein
MPSDSNGSDHWFRTFLLAIAIPGFVAFIFTNIDNRRKDRLDFVRAQIEHFYGPLYVLSKTNNSEWRELLKEGPLRFDDRHPPTPKDVTRWRQWSQTVFLPNDQKIENIVLNNAQYINQPVITGVFAEFFAFSASFRVIANQWKESDVSQPDYAIAANNKPNAKYPSTLAMCAEKELKLLKYMAQRLENVWCGILFDIFEPTQAKSLSQDAVASCVPPS